MLKKELLSEVLGYKVEEVKDTMGSTLYFNNEEHGDFINVFELAHHNCKGWAYEQGYIFGSGMALSSWGYAELYTMESIEEFGDEAKPVKTSSDAVPEYENVFRCCEWILEKSKK